MSRLPIIRGQCTHCGFSRNMFLNELHRAVPCEHRALGCEGTIKKVWTGSKKNIPKDLLAAYSTCSCLTSNVTLEALRHVEQLSAHSSPGEEDEPNRVQSGLAMQGHRGFPARSQTSGCAFSSDSDALLDDGSLVQRSKTDIVVGSRVHALSDGQWLAGVVVTSPKSSSMPELCWTVQCDSHEIGGLISTASVKALDTDSAASRAQDAPSPRDGVSPLREWLQVRDNWRYWKWRFVVVTEDHRLRTFNSKSDADSIDSISLVLDDIDMRGASVAHKIYRSMGVLHPSRPFGVTITVGERLIRIAAATAEQRDVCFRMFLWASDTASSAVCNNVEQSKRPVLARGLAKLNFLSSTPMPEVKGDTGFSKAPEVRGNCVAKQLPWCDLCHTVFQRDRYRSTCSQCQRSVCTACTYEHHPSNGFTVNAETKSCMSPHKLRKPPPQLLCKTCWRQVSFLVVEEQHIAKPEEFIPRVREAYNTLPLESIRWACGEDEKGKETAPSEDDWIEEGHGVLEVNVLEAVGLCGDHNARPVVHVECQRAHARTSARTHTLAPRWVDEPSFRFVCHQPLECIFIAVVDGKSDEIVGVARLPLYSLPPGRSCTGWVVLENPVPVSGMQYECAAVFGRSAHEGALNLGGRPLAHCYWGSSKIPPTSGAVKLEVNFHVHSWRRELLSCCIPPLIILTETSAVIRNEDPELLVRQFYEDCILTIDIVILQGLFHVITIISKLVLWDSPSRSSTVLAMAVAILFNLPFSWLLLNPLVIATAATVAIVQAHIQGMQKSSHDAMWNFWGHNNGSKQVAEILLIEPRQAFEWVPINRGDPIPPLAVDTGNTFVGRWGGEPGKIFERGGNMHNFYGHSSGRHDTAEILLLSQEARADWLRIMRGEFIPDSAVLAGHTETDGEAYVGRYNGEGGKINTDARGRQRQRTRTSPGVKVVPDTDSAESQIPLQIKAVLKSFTALGFDHLYVGGEWRSAAARLGGLVKELRKCAVWMRRALGGAYGAGTEDLGAGALLLGNIWLAALACNFASLHVWLALSIVCGMVAYAPGMREVLCIGLGLLRYWMRPARCHPHELHAHVPSQCLSAHYHGWASDKLGLSREDVLSMTMPAEDKPVSWWSQVRDAKIWLRSLGSENIFCAMWRAYEWSCAMLTICLSDVINLRHMFRTRFGRYNPEDHDAPPVERALQKHLARIVHDCSSNPQ